MEVCFLVAQVQQPDSQDLKRKKPQLFLFVAIKRHTERKVRKDEGLAIRRLYTGRVALFRNRGTEINVNALPVTQTEKLLNKSFQYIPCLLGTFSPRLNHNC
ncbi:hypothetical protein PAMP_015197 [Pampus punctatissimus]